MQGWTIVFDLDGTLVDTAPDLARATNHALADLGLPAVPDEILRVATGHGARRMLVDGLAHCGKVLPDAEVDRLLGLFLAYYEANIAVDSQPFPGAIAALDALRAAGALLAVCTNKRADLSRQLLRTLGMDHHFAAVAGRDTFRVSKPDPGHLTGAIQLAGGDAARAIMVGDSMVDVTTAKAAGVPIIAVTFGYSDRPAEQFGAEAVISRYADLAAALDRLARSPRTAAARSSVVEQP